MTGISPNHRGWKCARLGIVCAGLIAAACAGGCARSKHCVSHCGGGSSTAGAISSQPLAEIARGTIAADVSRVATYAELEPPGISRTLLDAPPNYQALDAEACRARAAAHSVMANLLEEERRAIAADACTDPCGTALRQEILALRAADERNRAAGAALELFYRLAEAEAGRDAQRRSMEQIERGLADIDALRRQGLPISADPSALERQRIELQHKGEEVARSLSEIILKLSRLIGISAESPVAIWPVADLRAEYAEIDIDDAVAEGLALRADLAILRRLDGSFGVDTLPAARGTLMQADPMLGQPSLPTRRLGGLFADSGSSYAEVASRQNQISLLHADRERAAADEIRQAAITVQSKYREIALAKDSLASWNGRVADLSKRREAGGGVSPFEITAAEAEAVRAESTLTSRVVDWKIAEVKLEQAQGALAE
jgi:hypothetical protein